MRSSRSRGAVLLVAIAVLGLLSLFAVAFASLARLERNASQNYTDAVRARLAARAGINRVEGELIELAGKKSYSEIFGANRDRWGYRYVKPTASLLPYEHPDLGTTMSPSFKLEQLPPALCIAGTSNPRESRPGYPITISGTIGVSYANGSDIYKLKVLDSASQINLNHPDKASLRRLLKNLIRTIHLNDVGVALGLTAVSEANADLIAKRIVEKRPTSGYASKGDIFELVTQGSSLDTSPPVTVSGALSSDQWLALRDEITTFSWVDEKVIRPFALNYNDADPNYRDPPRRMLATTGRAPVNLNTASKAALTALLAEVRAKTELGKMVDPTTGGLGFITGEFTVTYDMAKEIAGAIVARRDTSATPTVSEWHGPFRSWEEFDIWLDGLSLTSTHWTDGNVSWSGPASTDSLYNGAQASGQFVRDLVKAVLNPNSNVNKFGNDANLSGSAPIKPGTFTMPRLIDKADLVAHTTEGCFDSMGIYEVTSLGRIYDGALNVVAEQTIQTVVRIYNIFRLTTQQDFELARGFAFPGNFHPERPVDDLQLPGTNIYQLPRYTDDPTAPNFDDRRNGTPSWPGVTSYPQYSLRRSAVKTHWGMPDTYDASTWDGYLQLTNLIGVEVFHQDFAAGFSHGSMEAVKVRGYWDPRDESDNPFIAYPTPSNAEPWKDRSSNVHVMKDKPSHPLPADGPGNDGGKELLRMARPFMNDGDQDTKAPRIAARWASSNSVVDGVADPTKITDLKSAVDASNYDKAYWIARGMFYEGSALTNSGALVEPQRVQSDATYDATTGQTSGAPRFLAYSGDNLDLVNCSSIRFWVMPTQDPYARDREYYLSWVGEDDEPNRQADGGPRHVGVGFEVYKEVSLSEIHLVLEAWDFVAGYHQKITYNVTPSTAFPARDGWNPGTWHQLAVELGMDESVSPPFPTLSLVVDTKHITPKAHFQPGGATFQGHGCAHGHRGFPNGDVGPITSPNANVTGVWGWVQTRLLGAYDHCHRDKGFTKTPHTVTIPGGWAYNGTAYTYANTGPFGPVDPKTGTQRSWADQVFLEDDVDRSVQVVFKKKPGQSGTLPSNNPASMTQDPKTGAWSFTMTDADCGPDNTPGGEEWQIDVVVSWSEINASASCGCCTGTPSPWVPSSVKGIGGDGSQSDFAPTSHCEHDSRATFKGDKAWEKHVGPGACGKQCKSFKFEGVPPYPNVLWAGSGSQVYPENYCSDCHGCDGCKIRSPIYFGGTPKPNRGNNTVGNGAFEPGPNAFEADDTTPLKKTVVPDVDAATCASAIFDNIIIINGSTSRRLDSPNYPESQKIEDRYFEFALKQGVEKVAQVLADPKNPDSGVASDKFVIQGDTDSGFQFGAHYERVLNELLGREGYLGTMSWTSHPTKRRSVDPTTGALIFDGDGGLEFQVALHRVRLDDQANPQNGYTGYLASWASWISTAGASRPVSILTTASRYNDVKPDGSTGGTILRDGGAGFRFNRTKINAGADSAPPEIMVLEVRLADCNSVQTYKTDGSKSTVASPALARPLRESPIFDDLTLTLILKTPQVLYAEEGVEN